MLLKLFDKHPARSVCANAAGVMLETLEGRRLLATTASGIDPANMGKGDWIVEVSEAAVNVGADTFEALAAALKAAGFDFVVVKAGDGNDGPLLDYEDGASTPKVGSWSFQFTRQLIETMHAEGIKVLGYHFVFGGGDVTGSDTLSTPALEQKVALDILSLGADGLVVSADTQLENAPNNKTNTENYMKAIRAQYPDAFIAYAPPAYVSDHGNFPYEQFAKYSDAAMPKGYYTSLSKAGGSPEKMIADINSNWTTLYNTFTSGGHPDYRRPIVPIGAGFNTDTDRITESEMNRWFDTLKFDQGSPSGGVYNGTSLFNVQQHTPEMWQAIREQTIGQPGGYVTGHVFQDNNGDGIESAGDPDLLGWTVYADTNSNGVLDKGEVRTTTDSSGNYKLFYLPSGAHVIRIQLPDQLWRMTTTSTRTVNVADEQTSPIKKFGVTQNPQFAGTVYNDINADGTRQDDEPGLAGATVWVDFDGDGRLDTSEPRRVTKGNGRYAFTVPVGSYIVRQAPPAGFRGVAPNRGFQRVRGLTRGITVDGFNFGDTSLTLIKGTIFNDVNRDGIFNTGDAAGAPITVWADLDLDGNYDSASEPTASVGADGVYRFTTLEAGTYQIRGKAASGWIQTRPATGVYILTLGSGGSTSKKDFGAYQP